MGAHEYKVRSIGDASVEKVEVGTFPDEVEFGYPDNYFDDIEKRLGRKTTEEERREILLFEFDSVFKE